MEYFDFSIYFLKRKLLITHSAQGIPCSEGKLKSQSKIEHRWMEWALFSFIYA